MILNNENEKILSRKDVSKLLGISQATLWRWSKNGILKPYYLGGRVYYKYDEIKEKGLGPCGVCKTLLFVPFHKKSARPSHLFE